MSMILLKNASTACLQGKQQNIKALWNSNYLKLIVVYQGEHRLWCQ